jgi:hypothetical protein
MMARTHFVRILDRVSVNELIKQLNGVSAQKFERVKPGQTDFTIKAPDGDVVFAGLIGSGGEYMCRLHREVFEAEANV